MLFFRNALAPVPVTQPTNKKELMDIANIARNIGPLIRRNSSSILTGLGVAGSVGSLILGIKATPGAIRKMDEAFEIKNDRRPEDGIDDVPMVPLTRREVFVVVWKDYIPAVGMQIITISAVVGAQSINLRRQAMFISALTVTETAFREYQDRVAVEAPTKDRKVRDDIARDQLAKHPIAGSEVVVVGNGDQLFYDAYSGRHFQSTKQKVDSAVNSLNFRILNHEYASLNEFYAEIGLNNLPQGDDLGWTPEHPVELDFSTHMTDDDRPSVVITHIRQPIANFYKGFR